MAYRLKYSDYSTTASGPPDPAAWIGPPGPQGVPGPVGPQGQSQTGLTPEDFGAKGDGTTDDSAAFNAYAAYIKGATGYQAQRTLMLTANRTYLIQNPINLNQLGNNRVTVMGNGSNIVANVGATKACISAMGSSIAFKDLRITAQGPVLYGIQVGIAGGATDDQPCRMDNVIIIGTFNNAAFYNRGAEDSTFVDCKFQNNTAGAYAVIMDGSATWQIDQTTVTDTLYTGSPQSVSFNENSFITCIIINHATSGMSPAIWMGGMINRHNYVTSYAQVGSTSPLVVYYATSATAAINGLTWDVHGETLPSCWFFITGPYATPVIGELHAWDHYNQIVASGTVFKLDTTITSCTLRNLNYRAPLHYQSNVTLFDQPAKFTVTGNVVVPTMATFNGAKFSGIISNGAALAPIGMAAETTQGLSANGQTINVPFGFDVTSISNGVGNLTGLILAPGTYAGQRFTLLNASGFSLAFAAQATSHVMAGGPVITTFTARQFIYDTTTSLWWPA